MGGTGEAEVARVLAEVLRSIGCEVVIHDRPSREQPNLVATLPGDPDRPVLLLEAHMDTVAMTRVPQPVRIADGRLYGRGACDTKGSAAAMVAAMARLAATDDHPTVVFAGVADEETVMTGAEALLEQLPAIDGAIVGEPTELLPIRAHNGAVRFRIEARGRSAHTSRAYLGVNAIVAAARAVLAIQDDLYPVLQARAHELTGPALITSAVIRGGDAPNLVPEWCVVEVDRRLAPGEIVTSVLGEVDALLDRVRHQGVEVSREEPWVILPAIETPPAHPLVITAEAVVGRRSGRSVTASGVPFGTDASMLAGLGSIPCIVLGPGSIDQAHTEDEWVEIDQVVRAVEIYEGIAREFAARVA
jgi:acetylornithine deacetylase